MRLGQILVKRGLVTPPAISAALQRQKTKGGRLGENLIALGYLTAEQLASLLTEAPTAPSQLSAMRLERSTLRNLALKCMYLGHSETLRDLGDCLKLPDPILKEVLAEARQQNLIRVIAPADGDNQTSGFVLSEAGRNAAQSACDQNGYLGPAPVSLSAYQEQIEAQRISNELLETSLVERGFRGADVAKEQRAKLLQAVASGRAILLLGAPAEVNAALAIEIGALFKDAIHVPYAVEVAGQIITIFDRALHCPISPAEAVTEQGEFSSSPTADKRWIRCARPVVMADSNFTLAMLQPEYNASERYYDAPIHVKAINGILCINEFGHQDFSPAELLTRWHNSIENKIVHLQLGARHVFPLPFDLQLVLASELPLHKLFDDSLLSQFRYYPPTLVRVPSASPRGSDGGHFVVPSAESSSAIEK